MGNGALEMLLLLSLLLLSLLLLLFIISDPAFTEKQIKYKSICKRPQEDRQHCCQSLYNKPISNQQLKETVQQQQAQNGQITK